MMKMINWRWFSTIKKCLNRRLTVI